MDQKKEAEIVARVLGGERQAYSLLVDEYKSAIYNLAYRMTGNLQDADDLTQDTFIRAYQYLSQYDPQRKFFTWLYTIGINITRNHLKRIGNQKTMDSGLRENAADVVHEDGPTTFHENHEGDVLIREREERLEVCLGFLSTDIRELIVLRFYQGLPFEEIAEITGFSQSAVKMRIYRGLEKLKNIFEKM